MAAELRPLNSNFKGLFNRRIRIRGLPRLHKNCHPYATQPYPLVSLSTYDPAETQWRESGFLALIQCYPAFPDFPVDVAADMLTFGRLCQGEFTPEDRDLHALLAFQKNPTFSGDFFPLAYFTKKAIRGLPALKKLRGNPEAAQAATDFVLKLQDEYRKARDTTVHQLYHAILIAFLRQMGEVITCLKALCKHASSTANVDSSGSDQD